MEFPGISFTPISEVGEFGLIKRIQAILPRPHPEVIVGIGDDAAALALEASQEDGRLRSLVQLVTTDALIEHVHFDRTYSPLQHVGYKSLAVNVSDIAAMNGTARYATIAIGVPNNMSVEMVETYYRGLAEASERYGVSVIGGDVTGAHKMVISVTVFGACESDRLVKRSGASPGDILCVTGSLGASYAGLRILQHHKDLMLEEGDGYAPDLSVYSHVVERHLRPDARTDVVAAFAEAGIKPTAMIDLSDGLASDLRHICSDSGCGADIELDLIPISEEANLVAAELHEPVDRYALRGGEDYELLFSIDPADQSKIEGLNDISVIGVCLKDGEGVRVTRDGLSEDLPDPGFAHF